MTKSWESPDLVKQYTHPMPDLIYCSLCEQPMPKAEMYEHVRTKHEAVFNCMIELIKEVRKV